MRYVKEDTRLTSPSEASTSEASTAALMQVINVLRELPPDERKRVLYAATSFYRVQP